MGFPEDEVLETGIVKFDAKFKKSVLGLIGVLGVDTCGKVFGLIATTIQRHLRIYNCSCDSKVT